MRAYQNNPEMKKLQEQMREAGRKMREYMNTPEFRKKMDDERYKNWNFNYNNDDENIVTFALPRSQEEPEADAVDGEEGNEDDWVSEEEDEEARKAVDRVLDKYEKAKVVEHADKDFDQRYELALKEKMDEWKRSYYTVRRTSSPTQLRRLLSCAG